MNGQRGKKNRKQNKTDTEKVKEPTRRIEGKNKCGRLGSKAFGCPINGR
jgi:hypothetical protein